MRSRSVYDWIHFASASTGRAFRVALFAFLALSAGNVRSQLLNQSERPETRIGLVFGFGGNFSFTEISEFANGELCGVFRRGAKPGYGIGLEAELPMFGAFSFIPSLGYRDLSSTFRTTPFVLERAFDVASSSLVKIERERIYEANISAFSFEARGGWRPWQQIRFDVGLGVGIFSSNSYKTSERLITENVVYTENSLSSKDLRSGELEVYPLQLNALLGGQYDVILQNVVLSPRVSLQLPLTSATGSGPASYKTISALGGVSLMYRLGGEPELTAIPEIFPPPLPVEQVEKTRARPALSLQVRAVGLTESGEEIPEPVVAIENVRVTDISPTLNYIFFDDGGANIPDRYNQFSSPREAGSFNPAALFSLNAQEIHYDVLNIIGSRLRDDPKARITLTGTKSLRSLDSLSDEIALSRSSNVAKYLQDVWGISPSRIRIRSRGLPEKASDETTASGQAENRRVEIAATPSVILGPVETKKLERTATPPRMVFDPTITSEAGVAKFTITIKHGARTLKHIDGLSGGNQQRWLWNIPAENLIARGDSVIWIAEVEDSLGARTTLTGAIRIRKSEQFKDITKLDTTADKSLERFNLLLFDYSATSSTNEQAYTSLLDRVARSVTPEAHVSLIGHTDITGDPGFNDRLSLDRATKASFLLSSRLRNLGIGTPQLSLEGHGARDVLYDNSSAEGRMLSRTVRIFIERDLRK